MSEQAKLVRKILAVFHAPEELCILVEPSSLGIPDEDFFNKKAPGGLYRKLQEAWILSRLGVAISKAIAPVTVSIVDRTMLDGILRFHDGREWEFEVVIVLRPGRILGEDYRRRNNPIPRNILKKVKKVQEFGLARHLVAYLNYGGAAPDLAQVAKSVPQAESAFETTWLLTEAQFALLFAKADVGHRTRIWKDYWEWLPEKCR